MTVHYLKFGQVACDMPMPPAVWPDGNVWSSQWKDVTCEKCRGVAGWAGIETITQPAEAGTPNHD